MEIRWLSWWCSVRQTRLSLVLYKCYCWQSWKIICIRNSKYDSEVACKERKKKSFKELEILIPHTHPFMSFYREKANSSQEGKKKNLLLARVARELLIPQFSSGNISLTLYFFDQVSLIRKSWENNQLVTPCTLSEKEGIISSYK